MRVGWLPGRQNHTTGRCPVAIPELIALDSESIHNPPDIVLLDHVEEDVLTRWAQHPIVLIVRGGPTLPAGADCEALLLELPSSSDEVALRQTLQHAEAAAQQLQHLRQRLAETQRRLVDRILVEKAKGLLTKRFGLSEDEAYRRMRLQSRQERRPMREIAEALLTSCEILPLEPAETVNGTA